VRANAERIRRVELPSYEQLVNVRAKRYRLLADVYARLARRQTDAAPDSEYCAWRRLLDADPAGTCQCSDDETSATETTTSGRNTSSSMPAFDGCDLPPVEPLIHHRYLHHYHHRRQQQHSAAAAAAAASSSSLFVFQFFSETRTMMIGS